MSVLPIAAKRKHAERNTDELVTIQSVVLRGFESVHPARTYIAGTVRPWTALIPPIRVLEIYARLQIDWRVRVSVLRVRLPCNEHSCDGCSWLPGERADESRGCVQRARCQEDD